MCYTFIHILLHKYVSHMRKHTKFVFYMRNISSCLRICIAIVLPVKKYNSAITQREMCTIHCAFYRCIYLCYWLSGYYCIWIRKLRSNWKIRNYKSQKLIGKYNINLLYSIRWYLISSVFITSQVRKCPQMNVFAHCLS